MFLLDTNVVSELRTGKPQQSSAVRAWAGGVPANQMYLSAVTLLELEMGVLRLARKDAPQAAPLRAWLTNVLREFQGRVLPFDAEAALLCAPMHTPNPRSFRDSMIAASAQQHRLALATRNTADFAGLAVELVNPWLNPPAQ